MDIIRAWKDEEYLDSLSEEERKLVPDNPAGIIEMSDEQMQSVSGGQQNNSKIGCPNIDVDSNFNITVGSGSCPISSNTPSVCISNVGGSC